jgi:hypothetical protein
MALKTQSLILYSYEVLTSAQYIDFQSTSGGPVLTAVVNLGEYSLTNLLQAIASAMAEADSTNVYTLTANRNIMGGYQNRVSISSNGSYFKLLFGSGPHASTSLASLLGFNQVDYTGATSYIGAQTTGTSLIPAYIGYNYNDDQNQAKVFGAVNVSAVGLKEAIVFQIQNFLDVEFKYEAKSALPNWNSFWTWAIQQRPFDFTPEISNPNTFYQVTLEKTPADSKGLGYLMKEMLPDFPNYYQTGAINLRVVPNNIVGAFIPGG